MTTDLANSILAQTTVEDLKKVETAADFLSNKDLKWWFAFVFVLLILAISFGLWLLLKFHMKHVTEMAVQLAEQRKTHAELTNQLILYIKEDHTRCLTTLEAVGSQLERVTDALVHFNGRPT